MPGALTRLDRLGRGVVLAIGFLTRLPVPALAGFRPEELRQAAVWFPLAGLLVGAVVAGAVAAGARVDPALGALFGLVAWVWVTGALHLDGLADLADALGAAHGDRNRLLQVLDAPHLGTFGAVALFLQLAAKGVLLGLWAQGAAPWWTLPLIAAWARLGALVWSQTLPPLRPGLGERFAWDGGAWPALVWAGVLFGLGLAGAAQPVALWLAPLALLGWWAWLRRKLGGVSGDALGAGVEGVETLLLLGVVMATGGATAA